VYFNESGWHLVSLVSIFIFIFIHSGRLDQKWKKEKAVKCEVREELSSERFFFCEITLTFRTATIHSQKTIFIELGKDTGTTSGFHSGM
jgi:uncharacterized membrane protein